MISEDPIQRAPGLFSRFRFAFVGSGRQQPVDEARGAVPEESLESEGRVFTARQHSRDAEAKGAEDRQREYPEAGFESALWHLGREDSSLGQRSNLAEAALKSKTELDWIGRQSRTALAIKENKARQDLLENRRVELEKQVEDLREERRQLSPYPRMPPDRQIPIMPLVYIFAGIIAFAAEFPLAATLVSEGLRLNVEQISEFRANTTVALIVSLCVLGLAFKIFMEGRARAALQAPAAAGASNAHHRRSRWILFVSEALVLAACLATMGSLAWLRAVSDSVARLERTPTQNSSTSTEIQRPGVELPGARQQREKAARVAFGMLTMTLPMFAALSLFTGTSNLSRDRHDQAAHQLLTETEEHLSECRDDLAMTTAALDSLRQRATEESSSTKVKDAFLSTRLDVYKHGYGRGSVLPEDRSVALCLYDLHTQALKRLTTRRIRVVYTHSSSSGGAAEEA